MREILFKAKMINEGWRRDGQWIEGWYFYANSTKKHCIYTYSGGMYEIDPETLCQYTGMTDKYGKKIWEKDILKYEETSIGIKEIGVIRYGEYSNYSSKSNIGFYIDWNRSKRCYLRQDLGFWVNEREIEAIGNTIDNAELLEG